MSQTLGAKAVQDVKECQNHLIHNYQCSIIFHMPPHKPHTNNSLPPIRRTRRVEKEKKHTRNSGYQLPLQPHPFPSPAAPVLSPQGIPSPSSPPSGYCLHPSTSTSNTRPHSSPSTSPSPRLHVRQLIMISNTETMPLMIARKMEPMALTMAMRQAPMDWKTDLI